MTQADFTTHGGVGPRRASAGLALIAGALVAGWTSAHGTEGAASAGPQPTPSGDVADAVCHEVLRVQPRNAHYGACVSSLSNTLDTLDERRALRQARTHCDAKGLLADTPARDAAATATPPTDAKPPKSFFGASFDERFSRFRMACARLGLEPGTSAFADCVSDLHLTTTQVDRPPD